MKLQYLGAIAFCLLIAIQVLYGGYLYRGYEEKVLHITPNTDGAYPRLFYPATFDCNEGNKTYQLTISGGFTGDEYKKPRYKNLTAKYPKERIWSLTFKDYWRVPSVLLTDKLPKIRYELADDLGVLNIELVDPNMKQITAEDYPPNAIIKVNDYSGNEHITISDAVYVWNDNGPDKKMLCNMLVILQKYPDEEDLMWQNIHDGQ
jgi:hypothetical protein